MNEMLRLHFDAQSLPEYGKSIAVLECGTPGDAGTEIDVLPIDPIRGYVETDKYVSATSWFKLAVKDVTGDVLVTSGAIFGEVFSDFIAQIRNEIHDTNEVDPAFSDEELVTKLHFAAKRYRGVANLSLIPHDEWPVLAILVRIDIANKLAYDFAKYTKLELPRGATVTRDELYQHYINVAKHLQEQYQEYRSDILGTQTREIENSCIHVSTLERDSYETGNVERDLGVDRRDCDVR